MRKGRIIYVLLFVFFYSCSGGEHKKIPVVGFLDLLQDETLDQARKGFYDALKENGFDESKKNIEIIYRNAQGDQTALVQACDYLLSKNPDLIATNPTLSTITVVQKSATVPVFMMVSPRPDLAGLADKNGKSPANLCGVYETLDYIDTSLMMIKTIFPGAKKVGTIYNQIEPQSVDALNEIKKACASEGLELVSLPVNSSNETQLVVQSLLTKNIDAFFALPDNVVFASMEVIVSSCDKSKVPIFTSEEGLVKRGAIAAFGADMYQWGHQSGMLAATYLKDESGKKPLPEIVKVRRRVYNEEKAEMFNVQFGGRFEKVK